MKKWALTAAFISQLSRVQEQTQSISVIHHVVSAISLNHLKISGFAWAVTFDPDRREMRCNDSRLKALCSLSADQVLIPASDEEEDEQRGV